MVDRADVTAAKNNEVLKLTGIKNQGESLEHMAGNMALSAVKQQVEKQGHKSEELSVSIKFARKLTSLKPLIKPNENQTLVLNDEVKKLLDEVKHYPEKLEEELKTKNLPDHVKQDMITSARGLAERSKTLITKIEKDNLSPETRKDLKEDLETLMKELNEDNSAQMNQFMQMMNTLHEILAHARQIIRTLDEMSKKTISKWDGR